MQTKLIEMKVLQLRTLLRISCATLLVLMGVVLQTPEPECDEALKRFLSDAISARGGLAKLKGLKDDYSVTNIVYHDVYRAEILQKAWTMKPNFFRQDTIRDGAIVKSQQYDGKSFVEAYGRRVRFGLDKDLNTLLENMELNRIFSLLPIGTEPYPATLGKRTRQDGRWLQEVVVEAPSGLVYYLYFDDRTHLISRLEYLERTQYAQGEESHPIVAHIDSYRNVNGVLVADRLRLFSRGALKAEVRLIEYKFNVGLDADFFSTDRLRKDIAATPVKSRKAPTEERVEHDWKGSAYRKIVERLQTHDDCRFREVASYGDTESYRKRLFESGLSLVVDPKHLADDVLAFYAELLTAPSGFLEDCIVLAAPPESPSVSGELLLHEMTHAIIRLGQEQEALAVADDEYLAYYQGSLFGIGNLLEAFERLVFDEKRGAEPQNPKDAARIWRAFQRNLQRNRSHNRMTPKALEQLREWCGVDFDASRVRRHYLDLGVDPQCMPMDPGTGAPDPLPKTSSP